MSLCISMIIFYQQRNAVRNKNDDLPEIPLETNNGNKRKNERKTLKKRYDALKLFCLTIVNIPLFTDAYGVSQFQPR